MNENYYVANIVGNILNPNLKGIVYFKPFKDGVMVEVEIDNLGSYNNYEIYEISINDGNNCDIGKTGKFDNIKEVYNPSNKDFPYKNGNMPNLFSNNGYAYLKFYTSRFKEYDLENKLFTIYQNNINIGCGIITKY